jgi:uncharacterized protein
VTGFRPIDTVLLKTASRCNLDCTYCYVYHMGDDGWRGQPKRMPATVIDAVCVELGRLSHAQDPPVSVVMHGGEPLLLGLSAMTQLVTQLRAGLRSDAGLHIQTNGILLNAAWIELFARHDVGVSVSYDGPVETHDRHRVDIRGRGSHARVLEGIGRLTGHPEGPRLFQGVLAVVDSRSDPEAVYDALKATAAPAFDLLYRDGNHDSLPPGKATRESTEFGDWMTRLLVRYLTDPSPPRIRVLDDLMRLILGGDGRKEGVGLTDYGILVIDTDGAITKNDTLKVAHNKADRFEAPASILDGDLLATLGRLEVETYHGLQRPTAEACRACPELAVCGGGMPAHRWSKSRGYGNPTVFCADQKLLISHMRRYLAAAKAARSAA